MSHRRQNTKQKQESLSTYVVPNRVARYSEWKQAAVQRALAANAGIHLLTSILLIGRICCCGWRSFCGSLLIDCDQCIVVGAEWNVTQAVSRWLLT
jgi:hypothetical protein